MLKTLILLLSSFLPHDIETYNVDLIEVNTFFDDQGRLVLDQLIFWDFVDVDNRLHVVGWKLLQNARKVNESKKAQFEADQPDKPEHDRGVYVPDFAHKWLPIEVGTKFKCKIIEGDIYYQVQSSNYKRSYTQYDPELADRDFFPAEMRKKLPININILKILQANDQNN